MPKKSPHKATAAGPEKRWEVVFGDMFKATEWKEMDLEQRKAQMAAALALETAGPSGGRPLVGTLSDPAHPNLKELRYEVHAGTEVWRAAFAVDPERRAIVLVAGDKQGQDEVLFYRELLRKANKRYDAHLARLKVQHGREKTGQDQSTQTGQELTMTTKLSDLMADLSREDLQDVRERSQAHLKAIEEARRLDEIRRAVNKRQGDVAIAMGIGQNAVSQLEKRHDIQLSTLSRYVESIGFRLELSVVAPSGERVPLKRFKPWEQPPVAGARVRTAVGERKARPPETSSGQTAATPVHRKKASASA